MINQVVLFMKQNGLKVEQIEATIMALPDDKKAVVRQMIREDEYPTPEEIEVLRGVGLAV